ncbi:hypothetical protein GALL_480960 [mine drainage metagenome]|uniref:Uncharacterized protein n=1 Tax=mine drainage metagenome TaxID=410659 RepID=A0A1J5PFW8_9ZZZZ
MRPHETEIGSQVGEALPLVARHFSNQRAFSIDHLIMRKGQHEIFGKRVDQTEGEFVVAVTAIDRIGLHVMQGVVHPPHIPLKRKAQAAIADRARNARPCCRFLRDGHCPSTTLRDHRIEVAQKSDGFKVLSAAVDIGHPFTLLAAVVAVQHGGDGIHAQTVHAKAL